MVPSPLTPGAPRHWATNAAARRSLQVVRKRPCAETFANLRTQLPPMRAVTDTPAPVGAGFRWPASVTTVRRPARCFDATRKVRTERVPASPPLAVENS